MIICNHAVNAQSDNDNKKNTGDITPAREADKDQTIINKVEKKEEKIIETEKRGDEKKKEKAPLAEPKKSPGIKLSIVDLSTKEYLALFVGYGGYFPVADYGKQYKPANMVTGTVGIYVLNFVGLSPELHIRYTSLDSKKDLLRYNSDISLLQFFPGIIYRYHISLPRNTLTVYGRIWDGVSRVDYRSRNVYVPLLKEQIVENVNIFGISAGCYYDIWKGVLAGIDVSYSIIWTAGKPLQAVTLSMNVGYRIL
jgi:hypothetical protein